MIAGAARCPDYNPAMVKALMKKLDMNEKGFALLMNVTPTTIRLWTSGAVQPCGTAKRWIMPKKVDRKSKRIIGQIGRQAIIMRMRAERVIKAMDILKNRKF